MTWICPFCGFENYQTPLNSRHDVPCKGCGEDYISPEDLEKQIAAQIPDAELDYREAVSCHQEALDHISSLEDEISSWKIKLRDTQNEVENTREELAKLKSFRIFREVDRAAKARLDRMQTTLPLAEVPV